MLSSEISPRVGEISIQEWRFSLCCYVQCHLTIEHYIIDWHIVCLKLHLQMVITWKVVVGIMTSMYWKTSPWWSGFNCQALFVDLAWGQGRFLRFLGWRYWLPWKVAKSQRGASKIWEQHQLLGEWPEKSKNSTSFLELWRNQFIFWS